MVTVTFADYPTGHEVVAGQFAFAQMRYGELVVDDGEQLAVVVNDHTQPIADGHWMYKGEVFSDVIIS